MAKEENKEATKAYLEWRLGEVEYLINWAGEIMNTFKQVGEDKSGAEVAGGGNTKWKAGPTDKGLHVALIVFIALFSQVLAISTIDTQQSKTPLAAMNVYYAWFTLFYVLFVAIGAINPLLGSYVGSLHPTSDKYGVRAIVAPLGIVLIMWMIQTMFPSPRNMNVFVESERLKLTRITKRISFVHIVITSLAIYSI